jgi:hypothetical protein
VWTWTLFYELVAIVSLLLIVLGIVLAFAAQRRGEKRMSPLQQGLLWFPLMAIFACRYQSGLNLLAQDLVIVLGSCCGCVAGIYFWRNPDKLTLGKATVQHPKFWAAMIFIAGTGFAAYGTVSIGGDFIMQRREIAGVVTKKYIRSRRYGSLYSVEIKGRRFPTTADIYAQIQPLSRVHAAVGRGTGNVFSATTLAPPAGA